MNEQERVVKALIAVDPSEHSKKAVVLSAKFAKKTGVKLTLLHVIEDVVSYKEIPDTWVHQQKAKKAQALLDELKKVAEEHGAKDVETKIAVGPVAEEIVRVGEEGEYDYIVVGTRGMSGFKRMLIGSVAEKVVLHAHCPVVVVR